MPPSSSPLSKPTGGGLYNKDDGGMQQCQPGMKTSINEVIVLDADEDFGNEGLFVCLFGLSVGVFDIVLI